MNTPVSYKLAKLLKEKGFDEQNLTIYQDGEVLLLRSTISNSQFMTSRNYTAPTIAEVVMWLYEKHGIWIGVQPNEPYVDDDWCFIIFKNLKNNNSLEGYNSPTEAYERGIEYTLNNLI